jgi:hypothetical protein
MYAKVQMYRTKCSLVKEHRMQIMLAMSGTNTPIRGGVNR